MKRKKLTDEYPQIANEWHPNKNGTLTPQDVTVGSGKKVWWQCKNGHEWDAIIATRTKGTGCPYCAGHKVIVGETDIATVNPELSREWHPSKNGKLTPQDVTVSSMKKVWWQCKNGHEWDAIIANRTKGKGCPYCARRKAIVGENDITTVSSELSNEWHPNKNGELTPHNVTVGSKKKVWWQCKNNHEWMAVIKDRYKGQGCPYCSGRRAIVGETDIATVNPELSREWHPNKNGKLTPQDVTVSSGKKVWWQCKNGHEWDAIIANRTKGAGCPYCVGQKAIVGETDIATVNSELVKEWHPNKNGKLMPQDVTVGSGKKVWWQCKNRHEWDATIATRMKGAGCPYCAGKRAIVGETDIATIDPKLVNEWHPKKNGKLIPQNITVGSDKRVWWRCKNGHEWQTTIGKRRIGRGCPYCTGRKAIKGETDLATINPDLSKEWHPNKNGKLKPHDVTVGSSRKVWWQCSEGHEWRAIVANRNKGRGCPYCAH